MWKGDEAGFAVQVPTARSVCHGQKEWLRIVGSDGSHPDAAYAPQDPRYETLYKRLGINADNVQLTGIF
ncbi:hypothetical protein HN018_27945 (plasmid) [Lichenicola cladoniae]|uniref:Uncharacterized protein n=1 Tax=Lichenicola cladoniae TaxID=1484109 RepID=A0A6M8I108_9PROT|nr:hypothetical protein [Lichenicola cladoniae]NPD69668.1 hypothetical protein [Acetobacteraceae bacterium]QKE93957.1 hypothetical protein HN018_27945 [Lichenicola cladoniae]